MLPEAVQTTGLLSNNWVGTTAILSDRSLLTPSSLPFPRERLHIKRPALARCGSDGGGFNAQKAPKPPFARAALENAGRCNRCRRLSRSFPLRDFFKSLI